MELMINGDALFNEISALIEQSRNSIYKQARAASIILFWNIGQQIYNNILDNKRADYGKQIVSRLATQLSEKFGRSFELRNLRRMMLFAAQLVLIILHRRPGVTHSVISIDSNNSKQYV